MNYKLRDIKEKLIEEGFKKSFDGKKCHIEGFFFDESLNDKNGNSIKLRFKHEKHKEKLHPGDFIVIDGYVNLDNYFNGEDKSTINNGNIRFYVRVIEVASIEHSDDFYKIKEIANSHKKRDVFKILKDKIISKGKAKILVIGSDNGINDIKLNDKVSEYYKMDYEKSPVSKRTDAHTLASIIGKASASNYDAIAISRGGEDNYDIFYDEEVVEAISNSKPCTIAALGHANTQSKHESFIKAFDKSVHSPTALGDFFNKVAGRAKKEYEDYVAVIIIIFIVLFIIYFLLK